jgi:hypothetical protein
MSSYMDSGEVAGRKVMSEVRRHHDVENDVDLVCLASGFPPTKCHVW